MNKDSFQINPTIFKEGYENQTLQIKITKPVYNSDGSLSVPGKGFVNGEDCPEGTLENLNDDQIRNLVIANVIILTEDQEVEFNKKFYPSAKPATSTASISSSELSLLRSDLDSARKALSDEKEKNQKLVNSSNELIDDLNEAKQKITDLSSELETKNSEITSLKEEISGKDSELTSLRDDKELLTQEVDELKQKISELEKPKE